MRIETELLCKLLRCKELDFEFIIKIYKKHSLYISLDILKGIIGDKNLDINWLIYDLLNKIAKRFIKDYDKRIYILNWYNDIYTNYEIYSNYIDSYIKFENDEIQELFDNSKYGI